MDNRQDNDRRNEAPVPGERVRRLVGWHGYDWMKAAVALVLAALLLYGNAAGVSDGQTLAVAPTAAPTTAAMAVSTSAPPTQRPTTAATSAPTAAPAPQPSAVPTSAPTLPPATPVINATDTATESRPADIIVVTDVSGSMAANNRIAGVRTALANFADMLDAEDRVELISFSDTATVTLEMQPVEDARVTMKQIARELTPGGATTLYDTTLLAFREMQANGDPTHKRVIIVLTDGRDERLNANDESIPGSTATLDETLAGIARGGQQGVTLFTIGYGANADNDVLQRMAAAANGRHFAAGPATIQEVYQTIAQSL